MIYKFDEPIPTKSGESVVKLWNELQDCKVEYSRSKMCNNLENTIINARRIQEIQDDLGIAVESFPEVPHYIPKDRVC